LNFTVQHLGAALSIAKSINANSVLIGMAPLLRAGLHWRWKVHAGTELLDQAGLFRCSLDLIP